MIKKLHIRFLCFFWPIYLICFLLIGLKFIFSIVGLLGTIGTIILIKKNKDDEILDLKNILSAITYCLVTIFSIFLFVKITDLNGFNWFYFSTICIIDHHLFYFINWTPWKPKKRKLKKEKGKIREWTESILFAVFAATLIHVFTIQPYIIPTSSLEGTLLRGDFLFVSKFHYGSNVPNTPLFLPFMHNTLPFTENTPSYLDWIQLGYNRLPGFQKIKNNDIVVFNWPADQTRPNMPFDKKLNYVKRCVAIPGDNLEIKNGDLIVNGEIQKKPNRGEIQHSYWIQYENKRANQKWGDIGKILHNKYNVELARITADSPNDIIYDLNNIDNSNVKSYTDLLVWGSQENIDKIEGTKNKIRIQQSIICSNIGLDVCTDSLCSKNHKKNDRLFSLQFPGFTLNKYTNNENVVTSLFPEPFKYNVTVFNNCSEDCSIGCNASKKFNTIQYFGNSHGWDNDNYGPIYLPKEDDKIILNPENLALYGEIITNYENNTLEIIQNNEVTHQKYINSVNGDLLDSVVSTNYDYVINGKKVGEYTFKMDQGYYWMMGDNRHNSQDSRCWGFVPFNHVVGKPLLIWLSVDWNADNIFNKVRWNRLFTTVHGDGLSRWYFPYFLILLILFIFRKRVFKIIKSISKKNKKSMDKTID